MSGKPLLLDTGGWLRALAGHEPYAREVRAALPAIVPGLVLAEVDWHLRRRRADMQRVLRELREGAYAYEAPTLEDLHRAAEIDRKFGDIEIGLVDASIAALAERTQVRRVLTIDKDFTVIRVGPRWRTTLELAVPLP